jgi:hypothetical protein
MNIQLTNDEHAQLARQAESQEPRQLISEYAANLVREGLDRSKVGNGR